MCNMCRLSKEVQIMSHYLGVYFYVRQVSPCKISQNWMIFRRSLGLLLWTSSRLKSVETESAFRNICSLSWQVEEAKHRTQIKANQSHRRCQLCKCSFSATQDTFAYTPLKECCLLRVCLSDWISVGPSMHLEHIPTQSWMTWCMLMPGMNRSDSADHVTSVIWDVLSHGEVSLRQSNLR